MSAKSEPAVKVERRGAIAFLTIDNPPINALGVSMRTLLYAALTASLDDPEISAIVLLCAGRTFVAGADVSEFGTPKRFQAPMLVDLCELADSAKKPIVAAMHGMALGGGLELAMACHLKVACRDTKLGLPEVKLGLIPGSGGTVRLPRLVGAERALSMICSGDPISAEEAKASGLVDMVADGDLRAAAIRLLSETTDNIVAVRQREDRLALTSADPAKFEALAQEFVRKSRGAAATAACADAVRNAVTLPFDEALAKERQTFLTLVASPESKALRHLFFAERAALKVADIKGSTSRPVTRIGVVGAGTMGGGIAMVFANPVSP